MLVAKVTGVDFNSAQTDYQINIPLPAGFTRYTIHRVHITQASAPFKQATAGIFSSLGGRGSTIVANTAVTVTSALENTKGNLMSMPVALGLTNSLNFPNLQFRVGTAEGSSRTADVSVVYMPVP